MCFCTNWFVVCQNQQHPHVFSLRTKVPCSWKTINSLHIYFIIQVFKYIVNKSILDFLESTLLHPRACSRMWSVHACVIYVLKCYILFSLSYLLLVLCSWDIFAFTSHPPIIWDFKTEKNKNGGILIIYITATVSYK